MTSTLSKYLDKVYTMAEGGSRYCSKKSDDICGDICDEVIYIPFSQFELVSGFDECIVGLDLLISSLV